MSYYVKRTRIEDGRIGWTGPIRFARQAERERAAWANEGPYKDDYPAEGFTAEVFESTPEVKREVRAWQREAQNRSPSHPIGERREPSPVTSVSL